MTTPTQNPTMMDITITETTETTIAYNSPLSHNKKVKKSNAASFNRNVAKTSQNKGINSEKDESMISFEDTEAMPKENQMLKKIKHGVDITFKNKKFTSLITL